MVLVGVQKIGMHRKRRPKHLEKCLGRLYLSCISLLKSLSDISSYHVEQ